MSAGTRADHAATVRHALRYALPTLTPAALAALDALEANLAAYKRERDDLGPLFIRDACRTLGVDENDPHRMDALMARIAALAEADA